MATIRPLKIYPDPILHEVSKPVFAFGSALEELVDDMFVTMELANGVGLSAVQIGVLKRVIIVSEIAMINPEITEASIGEQLVSEGCLSVPGVYEERKRAKTIHLRYQCVSGQEYEFDFSGMAAFCIQHEIDHLDGRVFIDDLSPLKKRRARSKITKTVREFRNDEHKQQVY